MRTKHHGATADIVRHAMTEPVEAKSNSAVLSSGSTLLNLACADKAFSAFAMGKIINLVGDSSSGKTFLALTTFAEASKKEMFNDYRFIYDDAEEANEFDIPKLFGRKVAERLESPAKDREGEPANSNTIQDFHFNVDAAIKEGKPFIYVLDSFDAVTSEEEIDKVDQQMKARAAGKEAKGSYGMDKAKMASQILRMIKRDIRATNSLLIVISQTRDNTDPFSFQRKTRSGGRALKFYSSHEIWTSLGHRIKSKDVMVGVVSTVKIGKNKLTGKLREVEMPIYWSYGIDDTGSCIDWLVKHGEWKKRGNKIEAAGMGMLATREKLIRQIEEGGKGKLLSKITGKAWRRLESSLEMNRKRRYE